MFKNKDSLIRCHFNTFKFEIMHKIIRITFYWIIAPLFLSFLLFTLAVILPPRTEGIIHHSRPGIGNVTIYRDKYSIPHITGLTEKDLLYGAGYVHAQDRLWNMAVKRRLINGQISELAGSRALKLDQFMKSVGLHRAGVLSASVLPSEVRKLAQAYSDGVNDYVNSMYMLPLEFQITRSSFEPWTVEDSFGQWKLLAFGLGSAWASQLQRSYLAEFVGRQKAREWLSTANLYDETTVIKDDELQLLGIYDKKLLERINNTKIDEKVREEALKKYAKEPNFFKFLSKGDQIDELITRVVSPLMPFGSSILGSNNWVISGNLTASGKPYFANDPHLNLGMPAIWYNMELIFADTGKWVSGVGMPGIPFLILGRTAHAAWGVTTLVGDTTDLFEETLNEDGTKCLYEGKWYPLESIKENIKIRGQPEVEYEIKFSRHGPILPEFDLDEVDFARFGLEHKKHYAWASTGFMRNDTSFIGLRAIFGADNLHTVINAMKMVEINMNGVVATTDNHIAYVAMGRFIKRAHFENNPFVKNGSSTYDEWLGITGPDEAVVLIDPPKGYIVTANNRLASSAIKLGITQNHYSTARAKRIEEFIEAKIKAKQKITLNDMKTWQLDVVDVFAREEFPGLLKIADKYKSKFKGINTTKVDEAIKLAQGWAGSMDEHSVGALVYGVWEYKYYSSLFQQYNMTAKQRIALANGYWMEQRHFADFRRWNRNPEDDSNLGYCMEAGGQAGTQKPACIYQVVKAFEEVTDYIREKLGNDESKWKWGMLHRFEFHHSPMSGTPLKPIFHRSYPGFGNKRTVNVALHQLETADLFDVTVSANYRLIASMDESKESYYIIDSGISENAFSEHYDDQQRIFTKSEYIRMTLGPEHLKKYPQVLYLQPKK